MFRVSMFTNRIGNNINNGHNTGFLKSTIMRSVTYSRYSNVEDKLKKIEASRFSDPTKELERLKQNSTIYDRLTKVNLYYKNSISHYSELSLFHQISYGRSLEIFENIKETHYVFHHGQSGSGFLVLQILTNLLIELTKSGKFLKFETILRHPSSIGEIKPEIHTIEWYKKILTWKNIRKSIFMDQASDHKYTNSLIAVDEYLGSTATSESALSCFNCGVHGKRQTDIVTQAIKLIAESISDKNIKKNFIEEFNRLNMNVISLWKGTLYTICIPKKYFNECGYLSEPFGVAATINEEEVHDIMNKMQAETMVGEYESLDSNKTFNQVRLLTHMLNTEKVKIFIFSAISDKKLDEIATKTQNLVLAFQDHFKLNENFNHRKFR